MRLRLLLSFLVGTVFFTVLPIYAPFILLQAENSGITLEPENVPVSDGLAGTP